MILQPGTKLLVSHRRLFEQDHTRFFTGVVQNHDQGIAIVTGHSWTRDGYKGTFERKRDERTKIISLTSGAVIVYVLPATVDLLSLNMCSEKASLLLRDEQGFEMDLTEGVVHSGSMAPGGDRSRRTG